ncbi:hypothetical protein ETD85_28040 [Nonomuraea zeae]|uniref:Uncharacterized protein n=1 Tax=Nonomuraea zeae TaxID=1642303 RepID=A0A5S4GCT2_9ACTN|nr:hypothetical protein ETD85_28040 [Nonomuraea zeae]
MCPPRHGPHRRQRRPARPRPGSRGARRSRPRRRRGPPRCCGRRGPWCSRRSAAGSQRVATRWRAALSCRSGSTWPGCWPRSAWRT